MKTLAKTLIAATLLALTATASQACNINYRQYNQQYRIIKGVVTNDLGYREFLRLERHQANVRRLERLFRASGPGISPWECAVLKNAMNMESARIYVKRHN